MNAKVNVLQLRIPGQWNDGWLYKEHLILWSRTGQMYVAELAQISQMIRAQNSQALAAVSDFAIFRNDWKASDQFKRVSVVPGITKALLSDFVDPGKPLVMTVDSLDLQQSRSEPIPGFMLDVNLYADRIYVGSTEGFFESRFSPNLPILSSPVVQRLDHEIAAVNAKYSVINSSAGENGLLFAQVNFEDNNWWSSDTEFKRTAEVSYDNSFASYHLLNYTNDSFPTFLRAETRQENRAERSEFQESLVVGYGDQADIRQMTTAAIGQSRRVKFSETQAMVRSDETPLDSEVLGNSADRLLIRWLDDLQVVDISARKGKDLTVRPDPHYGKRREADILPSSVLKTYAIKSGFLVELIDEIHLITPQGSYLLANERAARIRTFIHARRYQDIALVVGEDSVNLIGFIESMD